MTQENMIFEDRHAFRSWLAENADGEGVWLVFCKNRAVNGLTAAQALEEALCFGWIDGLMEKIDDARYRKYFAPRRPQSKWSEKNRKLAEKLENEGLMTERGRRAIEEAKKRGAYEGMEKPVFTEEHVEQLAALLKDYPGALANFERMAPSARRAYTGSFFSVKTEEGRRRKLAQLVERLELNLNPMESLAKKKAELQGEG